MAMIRQTLLKVRSKENRLTPDPDGKHVYTDEQVNEIVKKRLARAEKEKQAAVDEAASWPR
jgi:hypothetical protein